MEAEPALQQPLPQPDEPQEVTLLHCVDPKLGPAIRTEVKLPLDAAKKAASSALAGILPSLKVSDSGCAASATANITLPGPTLPKRSAAAVAAMQRTTGGKTQPSSGVNTASNSSNPSRRVSTAGGPARMSDAGMPGAAAFASNGMPANSRIVSRSVSYNEHQAPYMAGRHLNGGHSMSSSGTPANGWQPSGLAHHPQFQPSSQHPQAHQLRMHQHLLQQQQLLHERQTGGAAGAPHRLSTPNLHLSHGHALNLPQQQQPHVWAQLQAQHKQQAELQQQQERLALLQQLAAALPQSQQAELAPHLLLLQQQAGGHQLQHVMVTSAPSPSPPPHLPPPSYLSQGADAVLLQQQAAQHPASFILAAAAQQQQGLRSLQHSASAGARNPRSQATLQADLALAAGSAPHVNTASSFLQQHLQQHPVQPQQHSGTAVDPALIALQQALQQQFHSQEQQQDIDLAVLQELLASGDPSLEAALHALIQQQQQQQQSQAAQQAGGHAMHRGFLADEMALAGSGGSGGGADDEGGAPAPLDRDRLSPGGRSASSDASSSSGVVSVISNTHSTLTNLTSNTPGSSAASSSIWGATPHTKQQHHHLPLSAPASTAPPAMTWDAAASCLSGSHLLGGGSGAEHQLAGAGVDAAQASAGPTLALVGLYAAQSWAGVLQAKQGDRKLGRLLSVEHELLLTLLGTLQRLTSLWQQQQRASADGGNGSATHVTEGEVVQDMLLLAVSVRRQLAGTAAQLSSCCRAAYEAVGHVVNVLCPVDQPDLHHAAVRLLSALGVSTAPPPPQHPAACLTVDGAALVLAQLAEVCARNRSLLDTPGLPDQSSRSPAGDVAPGFDTSAPGAVFLGSSQSPGLQQQVYATRRRLSALWNTFNPRAMTPTWEELSDEGEQDPDNMTPTAPSSVAPGAVATHSSFGSTSNHDTSIWALDSRDRPISRQSTHLTATQPRSPMWERGLDHQLSSLAMSGPALNNNNCTHSNNHNPNGAGAAGMSLDKAALALPLEDSLRLLTLNSNVGQARPRHEASDPSSALAAAARSSSTLAQLVAQTPELALSATSASSLRQNPFLPSAATTPLAQGSTVTPRTVSSFGFSLAPESSGMSLSGTAPTPGSVIKSTPGTGSPAAAGLGLRHPLFTPSGNHPTTSAYPVHQPGSQGTPRAVASLMSPFTPDGPAGDDSTSEPNKGAGSSPGLHMPRINLGCQL